MAVGVNMEQWFSGLRIKVLAIRAVLGVVFAILLSRLFFPRADLLKIFALAGLLTFAAYVMEYLHSRPRP